MPDEIVAPATPAQAPASAAPAADPSTVAPVVTATPEVAAPVAPVIPEKYDFAALKMPKGVELSPDLVSAVEPVFKKYGLTQEAAAELVQAHSDALGKLGAAQELKAETDFKAWMADQAKKNVDAIKKEWGHEHDANLSVAQRAIARFFSPALKAKLDETGLGNDPELLKALLPIGKMITEDTPPPTAPTSQPKSAAEVLYGKH